MTTAPIQPAAPTHSPSHGRAVLLGHTDAASAGALAHAMHQMGLLPILAFDADQIRARLRDRASYRLAVVLLDARLAPEMVDDLVSLARSRTHAAVMTLHPDAHPGPPTGADAHLHLDTPAQTVAALAHALAHGRRTADRPHLRWGPLHLDPATREARAGTHALALTPAQFRILTTLILAEGAVVGVDDMANAIYGRSHPTDSGRIRAHLVRLRRQLRAADPDLAALLITVRAEGYRLTRPATP